MSQESELEKETRVHISGRLPTKEVKDCAIRDKDP